MLSGPELPSIPEGLQGRGRRDGDRRGLLERQVRRLGDEVADASGHVFGECAAPAAEDRIAGAKLGDITTDRFDDAGDIDAREHLVRSTKAGREAGEDRPAARRMPVRRIDRGRSDPHQDPVIAYCRDLDLAQLQDIRRAVPLVDDSFHRTSGHLRPLSFVRCTT